jgi:hypothetical protein
MLVIFEAMGLYEIVVLGIDLSRLTSTEELIIYQVAQRQELLIINQVVSNKIFGKIATLKTPHDMWFYLWMSYRCDSTLSYILELRSSMRIGQRISPAKVSLSEFISDFETQWNRITHLFQSSAAGSWTYHKIVTELFTCQELKRHFFLA